MNPQRLRQSAYAARAAIVAAACFASEGCSSIKRMAKTQPVCATNPAFEKMWADVKVNRNHPIVDVHTHSFNSRYLPVKRIAQARRFGKGWWWIPSALVDAGIALITSSTPKCPTVDRDSEIQAKTNTCKPTEVQRMEYMLDHPVEKFRRTLRGALSGDGESLLAGPLGNVLYYVGLRRAVVELIAGAFKHDDAQHPDEKGEMIPRFLVRLMSSEKESWKRLQEDYPSVDLFVYQMMDMTPSYYSQYRGINKESRAKGFPTEAYSIGSSHNSSYSGLQRAQDVCNATQGRMIQFVPWNPFRSFRGLDSDQSEKGSLEIVKAAIHEGAAGVKFYPPLGYRASGNNFADVRRPKLFGVFSTEATRQWESRYMTIPKHGERSIVQNGKDLDALNETLFAWCARNDVPIFTHCNNGEFRAYENSAYADMANPKWWALVLKKHPNLRICFGHSGGVADWYGDCAIGNKDFPKEKREEWGRMVRDFCRTYPNVYCEFGCHDSVGHLEQAQQFYEALKRHLPTQGNGNWKLADKIMYGSDWYMPTNVSPHTYLESFEKLFSLPGLQQYKARFFSGNAMKYLKRTVSNRWEPGKATAGR